MSSREPSVNSSPPVRRPVQQPKVLEPKAALLLGHHQVPLVASPQLHITHIPDKLMPLYMHYHHVQGMKLMPKRIDKPSTKEEDRRQQQEMFEMMKIHQRLLYTIIATIGIPVVLLVVFYIDVSLLLLQTQDCVIECISSLNTLKWYEVIFLFCFSHPGACIGCFPFCMQ